MAAVFMIVVDDSDPEPLRKILDKADIGLWLWDTYRSVKVLSIKEVA